MKWIKASERLPGTSGTYFIKEKGVWKSILSYNILKPNMCNIVNSPGKYEWLDESAPQQEAVGDGLEFAEWVGIHCSFVVTSEGKEGWETDTDDGFFDIQQLYSLFKQSK